MSGNGNPSAVQKYASEFFGTFFLVFIGVMAIMSNASLLTAIGLLGIALAHGLALAGGIAAVGGISGAHLNPAVSIALAAVGKLEWKDVPGYVVAQLAAALVATLLAKAILGDVANLGACLPGPGFETATGVVLLTEIILTFLLVFVIASVGTDGTSAGRAIAPLAIGLTVTFDILAGGAISGAAMNPARWFGPAVVGSYYQMAWVYWVGPILGGALGAFAYKFVRTDQ